MLVAELFRLDNNAYNGPSWLEGYVDIPPAALVAKFGTPSNSDEYKVSMEYKFVDSQTGEVFSVYDYKSTSLYADGYPTPSKFKENTQPYRFHVGGNSNPDKFINWLKGQV